MTPSEYAALSFSLSKYSDNRRVSRSLSIAPAASLRFSHVNSLATAASIFLVRGDLAPDAAAAATEAGPIVEGAFFEELCEAALPVGDGAESRGDASCLTGVTGAATDADE